MLVPPGAVSNWISLATQNEEFLTDDLYLGIRRPRVRGKEYDEFVDTFVQSARKLYPRALIHFVRILSSLFDY